MKNETLKTGMAICKHCGGTYNRKECIRIYGEFSAPAINGFCSASCYTQHDVKPEPQPQDESQKELFTGGQWVKSHKQANYYSIHAGLIEIAVVTGEMGSDAISNVDLMTASKDMYKLIQWISRVTNNPEIGIKCDAMIKKATPNK